MDYIDSVDMYDFVFSNPFKMKMNENILLHLLHDILTGIDQAISDRLGLQQLKRAQLCHRDIKMENFLVFKTNKNQISAKFIDFNYMVRASRAKENITIGSPTFMAPELFSPSNYKDCYAADIYATGVTFYTFIFKYFPFSDAKAKILHVFRAIPPTFPISQELANLIILMLHPSPRNRLTIEQILANTIWKNLK